MPLPVGQRPGYQPGIHGVCDAAPIQRLAAAVIALAIDDARLGVPKGRGSARVASDEPRDWLAAEATRESWIALVTPDGLSAGNVQARLVAFAGVAGSGH